VTSQLRSSPCSPPRHARKRAFEKFAIDEVQDRYQHIRPLCCWEHLTIELFQECFTAATNWFQAQAGGLSANSAL
jgi:hypothetical protein